MIRLQFRIFDVVHYGAEMLPFCSLNKVSRKLVSCTVLGRQYPEEERYKPFTIPLKTRLLKDRWTGPQLDNCICFKKTYSHGHVDRSNYVFLFSLFPYPPSPT